jgi:hypothetical protein
MSISLVFIGILTLIVLVIVGIHLVSKAKGSNNGFIDSIPPTTSSAQQQSNLAFNTYLPKPVWGDFVFASSVEGQCLNYTISAGQFTPEYPSYNSLNSGGGRGYFFSTQTCLDVDQIFAQAGYHVCEYDNNGSAGSGCILTVPTKVLIDGNYVTKYPGTVVPRGTIEGLSSASGTGSYFVPCNAGNFTTTITPDGSNGSNACGGAIGLISPNFTPISNISNPISMCTNSNQPNRCLAFSNPKTNEISYDVELRECDLGDFEQIFRITRYSIDTNYNITQDDKGVFASIVFRENGFYLAPDLVTPDQKTYLYDILFKDSVLSLLPTQRKDTILLKLINPASDTTRNGVYWLLQNQLTDPSYDPATIPPQQYFGCNIYGGLNETQRIGKCDLNGVPPFYQPTPPTPPQGPNSYNGTSPISPQQIVYIPNIYQFPLSTTDLSGLWSYLENQFSINMIQDSNGTNLPVLQAFRKQIPVIISTQACSDPNGCIANYSPGSPSILSSDQLYSDTQFLSYLNIRSDITTGVSPLTPGCAQLVTGLGSIIYNPFNNSNSDIITSTPNSTQSST